MTRCTVFLAIGVIGLAFSARADTPPAIVDQGGEVEDVVFFHDEQPVFLRLRVWLDGLAHRDALERAVSHLFGSLDADQNGVVTTQELNRSNWAERMRNESGGGPVRRVATPNATPAKAENFPSSHNAKELARALRSVLAPLELRNQPKNNDGSELLFERLDRNGDRKLSQSELDAAADALGSYDEDDDEIIRAGELRAYRNPLFGEGVPQAGPVDVQTTPFMLATSHEPHTRLAARLIKRYDIGSRDNPREKDHKLARFEIGLDETAFRQADADDDGALDADELTRFLDAPAPSLEITVKIVTGTDGKTTVEAGSRWNCTPFIRDRMRKPADGRLDLLDDRIQVEFAAGPSAANPRNLNIREFYKNQFAFADADGNKTVDKKETERNGVLNNNFDLMDRNADGKLTEEEVLGFVDQQIEVANSRVFLMITDQGRALFEALDANRDRCLGTREFRTALRRLSTWDTDADGQLGQNEIPQHLRITFAQAQPAFLIRFGFNPFDNEQNRSDSNTGAPKWFSKMDANHDGDLSPREFLGTTANFRRLDADGDGLIDASEAQHVP